MHPSFSTRCHDVELNSHPRIVAVFFQQPLISTVMLRLRGNGTPCSEMPKEGKSGNNRSKIQARGILNSAFAHTSDLMFRPTHHPAFAHKPRFSNYPSVQHYLSLTSIQSRPVQEALTIMAPARVEECEEMLELEGG